MMLEDLYRLLRSGHVQAQGIVDTITQPLVVLDENFCVTNANNAFVHAFKVHRDEILGRSLFDLGDGQWNIEELRHLIANVIPKSLAVIGYEVTHDFPVIGRKTFLIEARRMVHAENNSQSILVAFEDATERRRAEVEKDTLVLETRHRMKNLLAVVRAIAMQTDTAGHTADEYREAFLGRLDVTLRAQEMTAEVERADFMALLQATVGAVAPERVRIAAGPAVPLSRSRVLPVSMIFHELTTNAIKYGALSVPDGLVHIGWGVEPLDNGRILLTCEWREENGPPVSPPRRLGYGTELIEGTARHLGGEAELFYDAGGLRVIIKLKV